MTAGQMKKLIEERHSKDFVVTECKNGQSWGGNFRKLDAWAMLRTWSPWTTIGYEVKVSRNDFLNDNKWTEYLPYCHLFYFVCPPGIISVDELPSDVGLIIGSKNLRKLVTKRKAIRHEPEPDKLIYLMAYILMARTKVTQNMWETNIESDRCKIIESYLEDAKKRQVLAANVRGHIREVYQQSLDRESQTARLMQQVEAFKRQLLSLGLEWNYESGDWRESSRISTAINELRQNLSSEELQNMKRIGQQLEFLSDNLIKKLY
jgi:hypothetical protein